MSADTKGRLRGYVSPQDIENYIYQNWDKNVGSRIRKEDTLDVAGVYKNAPIPELFTTLGPGYHCHSGNIGFTKDGKSYVMFYWYVNAPDKDVLEPETQVENELNAMEKTGLSLWADPDGESVKIMRELAGVFGGYVLENDCNEELGWYPVDKTGNPADLKPIIHITRKELNEKYGGIVVVDDY